MIKKKVMFLIPLLVVLDAVSKYLALGVNREIIPGFFYIAYTENRGVIFGIFQDNLWVTLLLPFLLSVVLVYLVIKSASRVESLGYSLILSGIVGNLVDRFLYGFVVDFIYFKIYPEYAISLFNLADLFTVLGLLLIVVHSFRKNDQE